MFPKKGENIPEIRFPEFSDAWKQRKVGDLLVERREMVTEDNEYPLMAFIANEGVAPKGDRFDRSALVKNADSKKYKRTKYGDFIYSSNNLESGSIGLNKYGKASISPVYSIFYPTNLADSDFIGRYFLRKDFIGQMIRWRQGVVYGQWKIPEADFLNIDIYIPSKDEQEKIGQILDKVDNTITLQQRKLNSLQKLKKGLLQKMFPKNGENIPEIRFPEFSDAWKQRELKEVVNFSRGQGLPWADVDDLNGQFECILYGNLYTDYGTIIQNIKHKTNTDLKVKSKGNEVLIPGSDTTPTGLARALFLEKENVILGGDINILSVKHDDGPFLAYELNKLKKELIIRIKGTTVKHLQNNDLKDIVVSLPSLEEQRKISSLFSRLDNTITLQQRWLFYTHKQS